jgi:Spy/CpxP family protein refolding chaperone
MKPLVLKSTLAIGALVLAAAAFSAAPAQSADFTLNWGDEFSGSGLPSSG